MTLVDVSSKWPVGGLERVEHCPMCGGSDRTLLLGGLADRVFMTAPGRWDLHRCGGCGSAYLDPRPTPDALPLAYAGYYTHAGSARAARPARATIRQKLANGYVNWRFGAALRPAWALGAAVGLLAPGLGGALDARYRHLPRLAPGARVLDVGCGAGGFLDLVRASGWTAVGVDFDPNAVNAARARGLDVHVGDIGRLEGEPGMFDAISFNHVIEHLFSPGKAINQAFRLLRPGGAIHLELPNVNALGLEVFGQDWRGLEPPRHLVLPSRDALEEALVEAGFECPRFIPIDAWRAMVEASQEIRKRRLGEGRYLPLTAVRSERRNDQRAEFFALTARRPL
jgi:SAM-dependent methyltransferase